MNYEIDCQHWSEITDMSDIEVPESSFKSLPCIFPMRYVLPDGQTTREATARCNQLRRIGECKWTADDRAFKAQVDAESKAFSALKAEIKYAGNPPFVTEEQKMVLDRMMQDGANLRALTEQQAQFYRDNGFEIYA